MNDPSDVATAPLPLPVIAPVSDVMPLPPVPNGPTVAPFTRIYAPDVVLQKSPSTGEVGAVPCGIFNPACDVVEAVVVNSVLLSNTKPLAFEHSTQTVSVPAPAVPCILNLPSFVVDKESWDVSVPLLDETK